jgi:NAD(P)-dependent dehydrogenase (short-subunit alcohol dehydrogenase family)
VYFLIYGEALRLPHQPGKSAGPQQRGNDMRVWFITGASRGFGALIAQEALAAGDAVVATARDPSTITKRLGTHERLLAARLDVSNENEAHEAVGQAVKKFGRIDILINNAGYGLLGAIEEASADETQRLFGTNVFGLLSVTRAALPHMRRQRAGHIINVSSVGGYTGYPGWGVYSATKFAVEGISEALAEEVAPLGLKVTVVEPGFFRTDFLEETSLSRTAQEIDDYGEGVHHTCECENTAAATAARQRHRGAHRN